MKWLLGPTVDTITFMHLSFKHCKGVWKIMVRHREQGEKIQLTSDDCLDHHALLQMGNWNSSCHSGLSKCITSLALSIHNVYMRVCSHTGAIKSQFKCIAWLPCRNKHNKPQIQCTGMTYIVIERKAVSQKKI